MIVDSRGLMHCKIALSLPQHFLQLMDLIRFCSEAALIWSPVYNCEFSFLPGNMRTILMELLEL